MDPVSKWLQSSREAMASMEQELKQHNAAVEAAMATIRSHGDAIEKLERSLEIIGHALAQAEAGIARDSQVRPGQPQPLARTAAPGQLVGQRPDAPTLRAVNQ